MPKSNVILPGAHDLDINYSTVNAVAGDQNNVTNNYSGGALSSKETGLQRLYQVIAQVGALHDSDVRFPPPKCHPNTRRKVLRHLSNWMEADPLKKFWIQMIISRVFRRQVNRPSIADSTPTSSSESYSDYSPIHWLYGPAGVGKSAIAQTLCEQFDLSHGGEHLIASFFFSRGSPTRNNPRYLFLTIAYCLAMSSNDSALRAAIDRAIKDNPTIFEASIDVQFQKLVVKPLRSLCLWRQWRLPKIVIIDGLDECAGSRYQGLVLKTIHAGLVRKSSKGPIYNIPLRFLITSRPEPTIRDLFSRSEFFQISNRSALDDSFTTSRDIATYLNSELSRIAQNFQDETKSFPTPWPLPGTIDELVQRASGQFIYAATVIKYVENECSFPPSRLEIVLGLPLTDASAFADLDVLYRQILHEIHVKQRDLVVQVLRIVLLARKMSKIKQLAEVFQLPPGTLSTTFRGLHSVLDISSNFVNIYHKSFADFLLDEQRSREYHVGDIYKIFFEKCGEMNDLDQLVDDPDEVFKRFLLSVYKENPFMFETSLKDQSLSILETSLGLLAHANGPVPMDVIAFCGGLSTTIVVSVLQACQGLKYALDINDNSIGIRIQSFQGFLTKSSCFENLFIQPKYKPDSAIQWCFGALKHTTYQTLNNLTQHEKFALKNCQIFLASMTRDSQVIYQFKLLTEQIFAVTLQEEVLDIMFKAAGEGSLHIVNFLIKEGKTWEGRLLHTTVYEKYLHAAARGGYLDIIKFLVENGADCTAIIGQEKTLLHVAAKNNNLDLIKTLLKKGINIDVEDSYGRTALYYVAGDGNLETVKLLVNNGAKIRARDGIETAVHAAARGGYLDIIKVLVENGADCTEIIGQEGKTLLHMAAEVNHLDLIKLLLVEGMNIDVQDFSGRTALHYAAREGGLETVKFLVDSGAKMRGGYGIDTAVHAAVRGGYLDIIKSLVENGADCTAIIVPEEKTLLHIAAENDHLDLIKTLLNMGMDIDVQDSYGGTALDYAARHGCLEAVKFLIKNGAEVSSGYGIEIAVHAAARGGHLDILKLLAQSGADITSKQGLLKCTPLHNAAENGHVHVIKFLLEMGIDVNSQDGRNQTAIHYAVSTGMLDAVKFLVQKAAVVDTTDKWGRKALRKAVENGHLDILKWFFETGLVINTRISLYLAAANNHLDIVKFLIENGAGVNAMKSGKSPLYAAAIRGNLAIVKFLVANGANVNAKTNTGRTVLSIAREQKIIQFLKDNGAQE